MWVSIYCWHSRSLTNQFFVFFKSPCYHQKAIPLSYFNLLDLHLMYFEDDQDKKKTKNDFQNSTNLSSYSVLIVFFIVGRKKYGLPSYYLSLWFRSNNSERILFLSRDQNECKTFFFIQFISCWQIKTYYWICTMQYASFINKLHISNNVAIFM